MSRKNRDKAELSAMKEQLIASVKENQAIWDITHEGHSKVNIVSNCWTSIRMDMQRCFDQDRLEHAGFGTISDLKVKWQSLRTMYRRAKPKAAKSGSGLDDVQVPKWTYRDQMKFLNKGGVTVIPTRNSLKFIVTDSSEEDRDKEENSSGNHDTEDASTSQVTAPSISGERQSPSQPSDGSDIDLAFLGFDSEFNGSEKDSHHAHFGSLRQIAQEKHQSAGDFEKELPARHVSKEDKSTSKENSCRQPGWSPSKQTSKRRRKTHDRGESSQRRTHVFETVAAGMTEPKDEDTLFCKFSATKCIITNKMMLNRKLYISTDFWQLQPFITQSFVEI